MLGNGNEVQREQKTEAPSYSVEPRGTLVIFEQKGKELEGEDEEEEELDLEERIKAIEEKPGEYEGDVLTFSKNQRS